jgi:hypothetical protein
MQVEYMKKVNDKNLLLLTILICSFSEGIRQLLFGLPIAHFGNVLCLYLFVKILIKKKPARLLEKDICPYIIWAGTFLLVGCIGAGMFKLGIIDLLWGIRTYLRMFLLFFDCVLLLEKDDLARLYKIFNIAIAIHFSLTLIQFFALGIRWDYLNGIFGTRMGDSSSLHALLLINSCLMLYSFYTTKKSFKEFIVQFAWMTCNAALAEIRGWYYEIIALLIIYLLFTYDFKRMLKLLPILCAIFISGVALMGTIYPYTVGFIGTSSGFDDVMEEAHRVDYANAIGRKNQISAMTKPILDYAKNKTGKDTGVLPIITGLGIGSADYATLPFIKSEFYIQNERMGYASFLLSFLYVETGIIGIIIFNLLWIFLMFKGIRNWKRHKNEALLLILAASAMAVTIFYNQTLRTNYGYIMWIFLGAVIVFTGSEKKEVKDEDDSNKYYYA